MKASFDLGNHFVIQYKLFSQKRQSWTELRNGPNLQKPLNFAILRFTNQGEMKRKIAKFKGFCKFGPPKRKKTGLEMVLKSFSKGPSMYYLITNNNVQHTVLC